MVSLIRGEVRYGRFRRRTDHRLDLPFLGGQRRVLAVQYQVT